MLNRKTNQPMHRRSLLLNNVPALTRLWEGEGGDGGDDDKAFDLNAALADPKAKAAIEQWAERNVASGLKAKNDEVLGKLNKYKVKGADGTETYLDPEDAIAAITFRDTEGKDINEKITNAVQSATTKHQSQINAMEGQLNESKTALQAETAARHAQKVGYELRDALRESGIKSGKLPLHEMYLSQFIKVETNDNGVEKITIYDEDGAVRYGKKGEMTLSEFVDEYRDRDDISDDWHANREGGSGHEPGGVLKKRGGEISMDLAPTERLRQHRQRNSVGSNERRRN